MHIPPRHSLTLCAVPPHHTFSRTDDNHTSITTGAARPSSAPAAAAESADACGGVGGSTADAAVAAGVCVCLRVWCCAGLCCLCVRVEEEGLLRVQHGSLVFLPSCFCVIACRCRCAQVLQMLCSPTKNPTVVSALVTFSFPVTHLHTAQHADCAWCVGSL